MQRTLDIDTKIPLWEFCERFVARNSIVEIYSETIRPRDDDPAAKETEYKLLEKVMEWQICANPEDMEYFKVHTDVKPSKYTFNNVLQVITPMYTFENQVGQIAVVVEL